MAPSNETSITVQLEILKLKRSTSHQDTASLNGRGNQYGDTLRKSNYMYNQIQLFVSNEIILQTTHNTVRVRRNTSYTCTH